MYRFSQIMPRIVSCVCVLVLAALADASVTTYTDRSSFQAAAVNPLTYEDFSGLTRDGGATAITAPTGGLAWDNFESWWGFSGSMAPGFTVDTITYHSLIWLASGSDLGGISSDQLWASNSGVDNEGIRLRFDSANAVGFDVFCIYARTITINVYDTSGGLIGSSTVTGDPDGGFFGVIADQDIGYVDAYNNFYRAALDNIEFGQAVPEPASAALCILGLSVMALKSRTGH